VHDHTLFELVPYNTGAMQKLRLSLHETGGLRVADWEDGFHIHLSQHLRCPGD